jgi:DNA-binding NarL/FixJ family response regulator
MKRIVISEDHTMFAQMVKMWLQQDNTAEVIAVASSGVDTMKIVAEHLPDILLQDMKLHDMGGVDVIKRVRVEYPEVRVFGITAKTILAKMALESGAHGCMLKEDNPQVIRHVIEWDTSQGVWVSPLLGERFFRASQELMKYNFTVAEMNILRLIGESNTVIATELGISEGTVRNTLSTVYQKTNITSRAELGRYVQDVLLLANTSGLS